MADRPRGASATADRPRGASPPLGRPVHLRRRDRYETDSGGRNRFCTHRACVSGRAVRGRTAASGARPFHEEASRARGRSARCGRCARCRGKRVCLGRPSAGVCMRMGLARRVRGVRRERSSVCARKGAGCRPVACPPVRRGRRAVRCPRGARPHVACRDARRMGAAAEMMRDPSPAARTRWAGIARRGRMRLIWSPWRRNLRKGACCERRRRSATPREAHGRKQGGAGADTANGRRPVRAAGRFGLGDGYGTRSNGPCSQGATRARARGLTPRAPRRRRRPTRSPRRR